ncbi:MAG: hydroxyacylglutathione hydrolase [Curvibacter sp. RIFCSPHIGHO2_12_FULL_63_18]|uniref:hydroxyacylglutathione hydrolase n=1 Tax=Rhodoferax sp. TaxID=50421 RepID=UPI0008AC8E7B|nr:hydroxyacylglutathione hydrolase [Rhodoferax sp.]OGO96374.1 MAG: hydroxyacylglutathione hydrolase [Curvibacter sp. GWA2_63_95]OGP07050.1 MAG: hydroxyacylglutathione hydrolase [Curvibacter sp. RIFCSPHIGHO2_12_FULL_63_18]HCX80460.1 hydroxyacylglutathione hydrolase [Rhodoferax sp.]
MTLIPLPAFSDNYVWMLHDGREALVVDPGDAAPVLQALQQEDLELRSILVTHHHADHTGGIHTLRDTTGAQVWGPARESIPAPYQPLAQGQQLTCLGLSFEVLDVPGHTAGHIAFYSADIEGAPLLFCGDTLFSAGCGRLFEGTPEQMEDSLRRLAMLPAATRVCCTHEYTLSNLRFALAVDPDNTDLLAYQAHCQALRDRGLPTLPSSIDLERRINPFLRASAPPILAALHAFDAAGLAHDGAFATLRRWKNEYR